MEERDWEKETGKKMVEQTVRDRNVQRRVKSEKKNLFNLPFPVRTAGLTRQATFFTSHTIPNSIPSVRCSRIQPGNVPVGLAVLG